MEEDVDVSGLTLEEKVAVLMDELPAPIQGFLKSPERDAVSLRLSQKHGLHADEAGVFESAYIYMLLGVYSPDEFVEELRSAGINEETVRALAADVNEQVFKKLRNEERTGGIAPTAAAPRTPAASVPVMQVGERPPVPPVPQALPGQYAQTAWETLAPSMAPPPTPSEPVPPVPIYGVVPSSPVPHPHARTMAEDMHLASTNLEGRPVTPASSFQTASVPVTTPQSLPPQPPQPPPQPIPPSPAPFPKPITAPVRLTPVEPMYTANTPLRKEFGNDPYREPIE